LIARTGFRLNPIYGSFSSFHDWLTDSDFRQPSLFQEKCWDINHSLETPKVGRWFPPRKAGGISRFRFVYPKPLSAIQHNVGGPFLSMKNEIPLGEVQGRTFAMSDGFIQYIHDGGFVPSDFGPLGDTLASKFSVDPRISGMDLDMDAWPYGAQGIASARPLKPTADLGLFLAEASDIAGQLKTTLKLATDIWHSMGNVAKALAVLSPRNLAENFINHEFGWAPTVRDLESMFKTFMGQKETLERWKRYNGQWLYRRRTLRSHGYRRVDGTYQSYDSDNAPHVHPAPPTACVRFPYPDRPNKWGNTETYIEADDKIWFVGRCRYFSRLLELTEKPGVSSVEKTIADLLLLIQLYGARVNPTLLWKHTPWTFLVDWFLAVGPVFTNWDSAEDDLVWKYAYIMRERRFRVVNRSVIHMINGDVSCEWHMKLHTKHRVEANPFSFGPSTGSDELSWERKGILAALGITHIPHGRNFR